MSPTNRHKYKYFYSIVQRAKDRRQKFHFCRLTYDHVTSNLISLIGMFGLLIFWVEITYFPVFLTSSNQQRNCCTAFW